MKPFQSDGTFHPIATGNELRRSAVRGAGAAIAGSAGNFALQIGSVVILARLLVPSDFGIVTMVTTFSLLLRSFGLAGFTEFIMQREELTEVSRQQSVLDQCGCRDDSHSCVCKLGPAAGALLS